MTDETKQRNCSSGSAFAIGPLWFLGWLFTLGFVHLSWWKAIVGLVIWPYFLGAGLR